MFKIPYAPLLKYPDYRYLFIGQMVSFFGTMMSYVCVPFQVYQLTKSPAQVGLLGIVELIAVLLFALLGGATADSFNRKKLVMLAEIVMVLCMLGLLINALLPSPSIWAIYVCVFCLMSASSYHRPAISSMIQKMIAPEDFPEVSALNSFMYTAGGILGPALGGSIVGWYGVGFAYGIDLATFAISLFCLFLIKGSYQAEHKKDITEFGSWQKIKEGLAYAKNNQILMGTYIVDIVAMSFAYPVILFPMMLAIWKVSDAHLGWPMAAISFGCFIAALLTTAAAKIAHKGRMVSLSALLWGFFIICLGLSSNFYLALLCLFFSGICDGLSGAFRSLIWNEIIPNQIRGRLASIEMIGYMSGPLIGNFRAGTMAGWLGVSSALIWGGLICILGVLISLRFLPLFWNYKSKLK